MNGFHLNIARRTRLHPQTQQSTIAAKVEQNKKTEHFRAFVVEHGAILETVLE